MEAGRQAGRQTERQKRRDTQPDGREPAPLSTMAFARSASGPAGLSINTGAANLLWVPSFSHSLCLFHALAASPSPANILCLSCGRSTHLLSSLVHNLSAYILCHVCARSLSPSLSTFHSPSLLPQQRQDMGPLHDGISLMSSPTPAEALRVSLHLADQFQPVHNRQRRPTACLAATPPPPNLKPRRPPSSAAA